MSASSGSTFRSSLQPLADIGLIAGPVGGGSNMHKTLSDPMGCFVAGQDIPIPLMFIADIVLLIGIENVVTT